VEKKQLLALVGIICLVAFTAGWLLKDVGSPKEEPNLIIDAASNPAAKDQTTEKEEPPSLWVYVVGAVKTPGVYQLPVGSRVFQAVELAGAGTEADVSQLDMARVLVDGEKIRVPLLREKVVPERPAVALGGHSSTSKGGLVNINRATVEELDARLPGIGPSLAQQIVEYRTAHPFGKKEDIKEVSGIGDKRYEALKDLITVSP